jgi:hypothetical protein
VLGLVTQVGSCGERWYTFRDVPTLLPETAVTVTRRVGYRRRHASQRVRCRFVVGSDAGLPSGDGAGRRMSAHASQTLSWVRTSRRRTFGWVNFARALASIWRAASRDRRNWAPIVDRR